MAKKPSYEELEHRVKELEKEAARRKEAEEALRKGEDRHAQIVRGSPIPTFVIDTNHVITHCNKAFENLTGIPAEEIIGTKKQWLAFYSSERPVLADLLVDNASEEEIARYYGGQYRKSAVVEGGYEAERLFPDLWEGGKWLFFTASPIKDSDGSITGAIETLQDITKRKQAEEALRKSERRLRTLLDFVPYPIVVFTLDGRVFYLNPSFTEIFGWTLEELEGKTIPYSPPGLEQETSEMIRQLFEKKIILRHETKRLTKDGRIIDVVMRAAVYSESEDEPAGELVLLRDITREKRTARNNEAILRISTALPEYPDLEDLLDYISIEVKQLLGTEGSIVILRDEWKDELFFLGAAYDDTATQERMKEIRVPMGRLVAGKVIRTGEPIIVHDTSVNPELAQERDQLLGYHTKNLLEVPLRSSDRIIGVLCAINKKEGAFDQTDVEILNMIAGTVALSIENARFSEEVKKAYREVSSLNRAKDRVIDHLSHELKTPISVLSGSLELLSMKLENLPEDTWKRTMERAKRNLKRIMDIQDEADDIMRDKQYETHELLSSIIDQCSDELEILLAQEVGEKPVIESIRKRVDEIFGPKDVEPEKILLHEYIGNRIEELKPMFSHREVEIICNLEPTPPVYMPRDPLQKIVDGLIKNAIENTPDEGKIEIVVRKEEKGTELVVHDYGVGITVENQGRIFEGFFATQDAIDYSSKRPFDFNAGGRGADLLRTKIFSERYNFKIDMQSSRCQYIPKSSDTCPGRINECSFFTDKRDCYRSGGTIFYVHFPPAPDGINHW
ncbi:MAG: PAS domain S-box protein [Deltaproteobacteria bacterium]|nr:PAS domain S-box protein [Deltaproteobacteria bacterium]MBW1911396.1 PAS domain S-box protein [Deltaproteobacteria bacterium]MBW2034909.1 PAS domain S-box protein [Deltaproteobacteria bacterium]